jgi:UDP-GlcNAc:undecaprenyl-phosphate GlcNAc-1-phosphate transferase
VISLLWVFVGAAVVALLLTPIIRTAARRLAIERRDDARVERHPTPRLGGIAIATAWTIVVLVVSRYGSEAIRGPLHALPLIPILAGALIVFLVGLADDVRPMTAAIKLAVEVLAACALIGAGVVIERVTVFGVIVEFGWLSVLATMLWIIVITNAFNLMDGLDGLATGLAIIAAATCTAIVIMRGEFATAVLLVALLGALVGFLPFNFNPASIFLGDGGSLFIGFVLALTAISGLQKGATALALGVPLLIFALPLLDVASTVIRRLRGAPPVPARRLRAALTRIVQPDREHIHHRLLSRGLSHKSAVLVLYAVAAGLAGLAIITAAR